MPHAAEPSLAAEVPTLVRVRLPQIATICRNHHVKRLSLIGSSLRGDFDPGQSDLDFVVDFEPDSPAKRDYAYTIGLTEQLQDLFEHQVDVAERPRTGQSRFAREVDATEVILFGDPPEPIQTQAQRQRLRERSIRVRKSESYVEDILRSVDKLKRYVGEKSYDDYLTDELLRDGVERNLITIGEAVSKLRKVDPTIPPRLTGANRIIDFRNVLVHLYYDLDSQTIWDVLENHLPSLQREAQALVDELKDQ